MGHGGPTSLAVLDAHSSLQSGPRIIPVVSLIYGVHKNHSGKEFKMQIFQVTLLSHSNSVILTSTPMVLVQLSQNALWETLVWKGSKQVPSPVGTTVWFRSIFGCAPTTWQYQPKLWLFLVCSVSRKQPWKESWTLS